MASRLLLGDCLERFSEIEDASVDAIIADPPYAEIDRPYGRLTEAAWWDLMMGVCRESRRVLKPSGSAVFILQPNSRKVGSMCGWLFRFQAWACDEWNMVQDAYWWNHAALPTEMANHQGGMRASMKHAVWLGVPDCYRDQSSVLVARADHPTNDRRIARHVSESRVGTPKTFRRATLTGVDCAASRRGGSTPYNVIVAGNGGPGSNHGHGAQTPLPVCDWWVRYISPEGGVVLDPFMGVGTTGLAALSRNRRFVGIERDPGYFATASRRIAELDASTPLFAGTFA
jgi:DNA modification methylase